MNTDDRLEVFLYLLLREHITFGVLETIILATKKERRPGVDRWSMTEKVQAEYAAQVAKELRE